MKPALYLPPHPTPLWALARQMGVEHAVSRLPEPVGSVQPWEFTPLLHLRQRFADAGLTLEIVEPAPVATLNAVKLGLPSREEAMDALCSLIQNMGAVGLKVLCYNFMAGFGWTRTSTTTRTRGGALVTSYDHALMLDAPPTEWGVVPEERVWENLAWFLERAVPVAESAGVKLAVHPDDPPLSPIRGVCRVLTSVQAMRRVTELVPSPSNGITFCQGTLATMNADVGAAIRHFGSRGLIHFVHFRDVRGTPEAFEETFHDDGPTDMYAAMKTYLEIGFDGPVRPDHVPTMDGEGNENPGYETLGRLFAVGYIKGLLEAARKEKENA